MQAEIDPKFCYLVVHDEVEEDENKSMAASPSSENKEVRLIRQCME